MLCSLGSDEDEKWEAGTHRGLNDCSLPHACSHGPVDLGLFSGKVRLIGEMWGLLMWVRREALGSIAAVYIRTLFSLIWKVAATRLHSCTPGSVPGRGLPPPQHPRLEEFTEGLSARPFTGLVAAGTEALGSPLLRAKCGHGTDLKCSSRVALLCSLVLLEGKAPEVTESEQLVFLSILFGRHKPHLTKAAFLLCSL